MPQSCDSRKAGLSAGQNNRFFIPNPSSTIIVEINMESSMALQIGDIAPDFEAETTEEIDRVLDAIGALPGVARTQSSLVLSVKFDRH